MQNQLLYILDDLLSTFESHRTLTCSNCSETITVSTHPHDKYKINNSNKIKKFGLSITEGVHCRYEPRHIHRDKSGDVMDYYLSDDYDENGIMFCNECVNGLYPCFICLKLDYGGPGTDPSDCDYCVNKVIHHICRRDHLNVNITQVQEQRANRNHYVSTFNPRLFVCKYCLKLKTGQEFSHYIDYEYNEDGKNNDDTMGTYDDHKSSAYVHYSSNDEYCSSSSNDKHCGWVPPVGRRSMCSACAYRYLIEQKITITNAYVHAYYKQNCYVPHEIRMIITLYYYPPNKQHQFDDYLVKKTQEELDAYLERQRRQKEAIWKTKRMKHVQEKDNEEVIFCKTALTDRFLMILIDDEDLPLKEDFDDGDVEWIKYTQVEKIYFKYDLKFWLSKHFVIQIYNGLFRLLQRQKIHKWKQMVEECQMKQFKKHLKRNQHECYRYIIAKTLFDLIVKLGKVDITTDDSYDVNAIYDDVFRMKGHSKHQSKQYQNEFYKLGENNETHQEEHNYRNKQIHSAHIAANDNYDGDNESEPESSSSVAPNMFANDDLDSD